MQNSHLSFSATNSFEAPLGAQSFVAAHQHRLRHACQRSDEGCQCGRNTTWDSISPNNGPTFLWPKTGATLIPRRKGLPRKSECIQHPICHESRGIPKFAMLNTHFKHPSKTVGPRGGEPERGPRPSPRAHCAPCGSREHTVLLRRREHTVLMRQ